MYMYPFGKYLLNMYCIPALVHAVLRRQAGRLGHCDHRPSCVFFLMWFLPPQGYKGYPGPAGHPGEQVRTTASAPPRWLACALAPACPWPPPWALLHEQAPEPGGCTSHPPGAPTPPHLSLKHICLQELESTPAWHWHELLNSG